MGSVRKGGAGCVGFGAVELIIVRHARPIRLEVAEGHADPHLSEVGVAQAARTAEFLAGEGVDHIVSSSMCRALETARPLAERLGHDIEVRDDLRESDHRSLVYVPAEEMSPDDPATAHYFDDPMTAIFSDGFDEFERRVVNAFEEIIAANRSRTVAVFCHGMVTSVYLRSILRFDDVMALLVDYCGISRVRASSSGVRSVKSINETLHVRELL